MRFVQFTSGRGCNVRQVAIPLDELHRLEAAPTTYPATVVLFRDGSSVTVNGEILAVARQLEAAPASPREDPPAQPGPALVADLYRERAQAIELANRAVCAMLEGARERSQERTVLIEAKRRLVLLAADVLAGYWPGDWIGANGPGPGSIGAVIGAAKTEGGEDAASV